ncbi:MAG: hypothetical protein QF486_03330 [Candidatus Woesearchaeota archaeon]|jgi:hypothetical protein|nr:hypothetical protein [Candidatus Woesearchaeota archaeon]MDP7181587.1 hypothetical protein [Candidatus Woesearchaeota archaeon]MDP7198629.1 hypothetical protein [Candidatus Woesearchaeota archaeon]MDP7466629.1 hypothetical protein [Candidatus Woesearchaeota archaeon]MDP7646885.1 hypothetical protein [Candidatus Woesearchaeota archaeon]|tara:strand:+ start:561 stop:989 length:429 start_codon:yes stop_codon:yes gene_type:complete
MDEKMKKICILAEGIEPLLQPQEWGDTVEKSRAVVQDVCYVRTDEHDIVGARWHQHYHKFQRHGVEWTDWVAVYHRKLGEKDFTECNSLKIITRHQRDQSEDRKDLWGYNKVGMKVEGTKVEIAWINEDLEGPEEVCYRLEL